MPKLLNGKEVDSTSPEWMQECFARGVHINTMRRLDTIGRRGYLEQVARAEGAEAAKRLAEQYTKDWNERKGMK